MFKRVLGSSPIPNPNSSNRNASIRPRRCFAPPMKRSGLPARTAGAGKSKPGIGALRSLFARNRLSLDFTNLLHLSRELVSSPQTGLGESMCEFCQNGYRATRRNALALAASALALGLMSRAALAASDKTPPKPQNVISPDAALDRLTKGNARYVKGTTLRHDFAHERETLSTGQNPFAATLSCADSRIAPELCFDTARGDLFVCRVAGNFASDEMVASLEYAVQVLKTPLIMVLGHEACGAVDATIKSVKDGTTLPGHLPSLVAALKPAVDAVQGQGGDTLGNAIRRNVMLNVDKLKSAAPILSAFAGDNKIRVVGGIYELRTGKVQLFS